MERMILSVVRCKRVPVPAWIAQLVPCIDSRFGWIDIDKQVNGTRSSEDFALGKRYPAAIQMGLLKERALTKC